jgi:peptidoglycan/LPS O-acetylase OafA/YrhL
MHLYPGPADIVFGRPWAAWEPVWHWLEPALLVVVAIMWGWFLFTLIEKPANTALRRLLLSRPKGVSASA